ncbi:hypothetical protein PBAHNIPP_00221 [Klebsiella phage KP01]|nr:hypothetical protein [Klebsiella pneumoniae]QLF83006.1 hypothetical protein KpnM6E1_gp123 [Klebsiella phage KpnM6E1]BEH88739.1 hypothetical protein [Klebsiella phage phiKp_22]
MKFKEFLAEASSDVKAAAISAMEAGKYSYKDTSDESRFQFARDMKELGFRGNDVTNAWKSMVVTGEIFTKPKPGTAKPKAAKKSSVLSDADVKALNKAWADVHTAYEKAAALSAKLHAKVVASVDPSIASKVNVRDTPDLYAVLYGLSTSSKTEDFGNRLKQLTHYVGDVGRHYKKL